MINRVTIISDSSTCLPAHLVRDFGITILPINAKLDDAIYSDTEFTDQALLDEYAEKLELSGANHPFVTEYLAAIETPPSDSAVIVTPAYEFAAMHRNATLAASLSTKEAFVIDSRTAAAGQALVVLQGAKAAAAGGSVKEVVDVIHEASKNVILVAALGDTEHIARASVLPPDGLVSSSNGYRSIFSMKNGQIQPLGEAESAEDALRIIGDVFYETSQGRAEQVVVFHAGASELAEKLSSIYEKVDFITGFSMAMQVHTGPGVVGAAWLPEAS